MLHMIIEQTRNYPMRMVYDPVTKTFSERDHRSLCAARGFTKPYGWIRESGTPPDPHWDCILMSPDEYELGDEVEIEIIGVFKRSDGDHKFIAVERQRPLRDLTALPEEEMEELRRLYPRVSEGEGWFGREEALHCMEHCEKAL